MTFLYQYLRGIQSKFSMCKRDDDKLNDRRNDALEVFHLVGRSIGKNDYNYLLTDFSTNQSGLYLTMVQKLNHT